MVSDHSRLPPPAGVVLSLPIHPASLLRPGCRYQSRGACGQTVSPVRSGMTPTAAPQRGVGACRVDRGQERAITIRPSCGACEISRPRQPGPSTGHSAPPTPRRRSIQQLHSSPIIPIIVPSLLLFRIGVALSEPRSVRADSIPGSERHDAHCRASARRGSVPRRPGAGESHHHPAELRRMRDQPPAPARAAYWHIALHPLLHAADPSNSLTYLR